VVSAFGCFALSGDGFETMPGGVPAVRVEGDGTERCGGHSISDNVAGLAPELTPTSIHFTRQFVVDDEILTNGAFALSFAADDQASFVLNGEAIASCVPPDSNIGQCSATCQDFTIPLEKLRGDGQVNTLEIELVNLVSVPAGGDDFGWTSLLYSMCVTESPASTVWDASADFRVAPDQENPSRDAFGNLDVWHYLERPASALDRSRAR
jgi:hypothetical protein